MAEPENMILHLLRDLGARMDEHFDAQDRRFDAQDRRFDALEKKIDSIKAGGLRRIHPRPIRGR